MKFLIALAALLACGMVGIVAWHETRPEPQGRPAATSGEQVATISNGEAVTLADHLVDGRLTVVEFYADW